MKILSQKVNRKCLLQEVVVKTLLMSQAEMFKRLTKRDPEGVCYHHKSLDMPLPILEK